MRASLGVLLLAATVGGCSSPGHRMAVDVPTARTPTAEDLVAADVGRLLSGDPDASRAAQARLARLDAAGRAALAAHARRIPTERDPRWWNALDENGLAADLAPADRLELDLWRVARAEPALVVKGQAGLLEQAKASPDLLLHRLEGPGPGRDAIAIALAGAGRREAVPALTALFRDAATPAERRAAAEALATLTDGAVRPRSDATPEEVGRDVARLEAWWKTHGGGDGNA